MDAEAKYLLNRYYNRIKVILNKKEAGLWPDEYAEKEMAKTKKKIAEVRQLKMF